MTLDFLFDSGVPGLVELSRGRTENARGCVLRKERYVSQRFSVIVRFEVTSETAEDAEALVEAACEKAAALSGEGDLSYEGIEDIEEAEEE